ncbi:MAG: enoyl-CoA hydratase/isomerase family protein [Solirubrobacteraceae bacterium]
MPERPPDTSGPEAVSVGTSLGLVECELIEVADGVAAAVLWLNRPESLNALSWELVLELEHQLRVADQDPHVCGVLISGRGRGFCAGGDLKAYVELQANAAEFDRFLRDLHRTFGHIRTMNKPVVALVNGVTAAGGLELLLACDFAYAAESAQIGDLHLNYGQIGGGGSLALLPRTVGPARARELVFSARLLDSREACEWGLVVRVVPDAQLLETGLELARGLAAKSPAGVALAKEVLNRGYADGTGTDQALRLEADAASLYSASLPDSMEGLRAFAERRAPKFPGRGG